MSAMWRARRRRREGGATIVEAAFALPILLMFIFGLVDLGMWTFNSNQATNAAKDGARAGIVNHDQADVVGSADWDEIVERVESRLNREITSDDIDIACVRPDGVAVTGGCAAAVVDVDRVEVSVDWDWELLTPIAAVIGVEHGAATGEATMTIIGKPTGTPPPVTPDEEPPPPTPPVEPPPGPDDCDVTQVKVGHNRGSNSVIMAKASNNQLLSGFWVNFQTNGVDRCNGLAVQVVTPTPFGTIRSLICDVCVANQPHYWEFTDKNEKIWAAGTANLRIFNEFTDFNQPFQVNWG